MHYYEYFQWLCQSRNISEAEAYKGSGINKSSVSRWRSAYEEGREMAMSSKAAAGLSSFFNIPVDRVLAMQDEHGLSRDDWALMGVAYRSERELRGKTIEDVADGEAVTADQLRRFEEGKASLTVPQLSVICGKIGTSAPFVFNFFADYLYGEKETPAGITDEQLKFALWGDTTDITDADLEDVRRFAAFIKQKREQEGQK